VTAEQGTNQSVEKAVSVLSAFAGGRRGLRVSDVAKHAGLGQSTASRMLATLESLEFVEREEDSGLYRLGPMLITLAGIRINQDPVHREGRQRAQDLAHSLGLGVNLAVRKGASLFYLCNFEGQNAPKSHTLMGQGNPLHATGIGKCLLLDLSPEQRRQLLPEPFQAFTVRTITNHRDLDLELDQVRGRWYATEREELAPGRACVAAPIVGQAGGIVAALSISGPLSAVQLEQREAQLASLVIETADAISGGLGYLGPTHGSAARIAGALA
jgi:DNA-binding IclR family transcriptional regulator